MSIQMDIMDTAWSGDDVLLTVDLTAGERATGLTVRAVFDRCPSWGDLTVSLRCERVLCVHVGGVEQTPETAFVGVELERAVLAHTSQLEACARDVWDREQHAQALGMSWSAMMGGAS